MKKIKIISLVLLITAVSFASDDNAPRYVNMENPVGLVNPEEFFEYMIIKGDCLWFIADDFFGDPFKWKKIHEANPYILNPDWIFPNNWLVIPNIYADEFGKPTAEMSKKTWVEENTKWDETSKKWSGASEIDLDGDGIVDGYDIDGDGIADESASVDLDGDGVVDGYDLNGDGEIDVKSNDALLGKYGIDSDGDGVIDGVDIDGDGIIDESANIDIDGDGVIDGYDIDGDGQIDITGGDALTLDEYNISTAKKAEAANAKATKEAAAAAKEDNLKDMEKSCTESYCGKPGWKLGLHAGYPLGSAPEDETLNLGLLLGTPLGVNIGPLNIGLGAGAFTYDFEKIYVGGGLLASLCVNDLLKLDIPVRFQLHGIGFYVFGEDQGLGFGGIGSANVPFGKSPVSLGLYGGLGKYYPNDNDYNWGNAGAVLFYSL